MPRVQPHLGLILVCALSLCGCASHLLKYDTDRPAVVQTTLMEAGIRDERARFRRVFCELVRRDLRGADAECGQWLTKLADEAGEQLPAADESRALPASVDIVLVTGIFAECLGTKVKLLSDAADALHQRLGYDVSRVPVKGRASSHVNAEIIRDHIMARTKKVLVVGYSKGTTDTIAALREYPELGDRVAAFLSVAGVVNGSPLADRFASLYDATLANLPYAPCPINDKEELTSITRHRQAFLAAKDLPRKVKYFSIAAAPAPERVSRALRIFYDMLADVDPLNDGQVIFYDAILPRSTVLAYANADHWAIALPFEEGASNIPEALVDQNHFPRAQLLEAAVRMIEADLSRAKRDIGEH